MQSCTGCTKKSLPDMQSPDTVLYWVYQEVTTGHATPESCTGCTKKSLPDMQAPESCTGYTKKSLPDLQPPDTVLYWVYQKVTAWLATTWVLYWVYQEVTARLAITWHSPVLGVPRSHRRTCNHLTQSCTGCTKKSPPDMQPPESCTATILGILIKYVHNS